MPNIYSQLNVTPSLPFAEFLFGAIHFAVIGFVVETEKMQNAVEY
jgi:hypothetical protein